MFYFSVSIFSVLPIPCIKIIIIVKIFPVLPSAWGVMHAAGHVDVDV